jgi:hypothetical protein
MRLTMKKYLAERETAVCESSVVCVEAFNVYVAHAVTPAILNQ